MTCKKIEKYLVKSLDSRLNNKERHTMERHLEQCPACQTKQHEYQDIRDALRVDKFPAPKPYFWERLKPQLKDQRPYGLWSLWKQWGLRAIPLSFAIILFALVVTTLTPPTSQELSQSGILLRDQDPFQETIPLLGEDEVENPNMVLLFTSLEENNERRRYFP